LPASLASSEADGELVLDATGAFRPTAGAIRLFDYFLTTLGEVDEQGVRELVRQEARRRVPGHEGEVVALFDQYLSYLQEVRLQEVRNAQNEQLSLRAHFQRKVELQRARFGEPLAETLFAQDNLLTETVLD